MSDNFTTAAEIHFKGGKSIHDSAPGNDRAVLSEYIARAKELNEKEVIKDVVVAGHVSPDGAETVNRRLAEERSRVLAGIKTETRVEKSKIKGAAAGINCIALRNLIESRSGHTGITNKSMVYNIISQ